MDDNLFYAQLRASDLGADGYQTLPHLGGRGVHVDDRATVGDLESNPGSRVIVETLREAHVLEADRVTDAPAQSLAVSRVRESARQPADVRWGCDLIGRFRQSLKTFQELRHRYRPLDA